jgi:hypothetical protein
MITLRGGQLMTTHTHFAKIKTRQRWGATLLTGLGLTGLVSGCGNSQLMMTEPVNAQTLPTITNTPTPTSTPMPTLPPTATPTWTPIPSATPWSTPTPWPTPQPWQPAQLALPTLAPVPLVSDPVAMSNPSGTTPVSYAPPNGVDVFGGTLLRWTFYGPLAPDEWFDIKIKPFGSNDSVFIDWTKSTEYALQPWSGWQPGLYQWQIGIVRGTIGENGQKYFIEDTSRDSELFVIKWQANSGRHSSSGTTNTGGSNTAGGGGGSTSGGS